MNKIHFAVINHKHGINVLFSKTEEGLTTKIADYCKETWEDRANQDITEIPEDLEEVIHAYFHEHEEEFLEYRSSVDMDDPDNQ